MELEMDLEIDEILRSKYVKTDESPILLTLSSRLNYEDAKIVTMYQGWKKL